MKEFDSCKNINEIERFFLPNALNKNRCNYIKFGENSIGNILAAKGAKDYAESMLHQLEKLENDDRKFVYYVT